MMELISNLVNNNSVLNTFINLKFRWEDEGRYENFNDYANVMLKSVEKATSENVTLVKGTKRPFGIVFEMNGKKLKLFLKMDGRSCWLACALA